MFKAGVAVTFSERAASLPKELSLFLNFPVTQMVKNLPATQETRIQSLGGDDPLEKEMATLSSFVAWRNHGQRTLTGYNPWGHRKLDTTEQLTLLLLPAARGT